MKIHIDTASAEEQARAQAKKQASGKSTSSKKSGKTGSSSPTPGTSAPAQAQPKHVKPKPLPKVKKETKPPQDVAQARKRQTSVLKERQKREVSGKLKGPSRDVDAGPDFGFQTYPFL